VARRSRRAPLESSFANLIEFAPDATIVVDPSGSIVFVNAQTERVFGRRRDELIGQPVEVLIPERYRAAHTGHRDGYFAEPRIRAMDTGLELLGLRSDGTEFPVEISLAPLETDVGLRTMAAIRDVTDRKRAEEERLQLASERGLRVQAERLVKRLEDIQAVTDAALATLSLDELLQELLERIRTGVQADAAAIMLLTPDGNALTVRPSSDAGPLSPRSGRYRSGRARPDGSPPPGRPSSSRTSVRRPWSARSSRSTCAR
jgi:PAS domain S-box-containing protein